MGCAMQACAERIKGDTTGKECSGYWFDYLHCVDDHVCRYRNFFLKKKLPWDSLARICIDRACTQQYQCTPVRMCCVQRAHYFILFSPPYFFPCSDRCQGLQTTQVNALTPPDVSLHGTIEPLSFYSEILFDISLEVILLHEFEMLFENRKRQRLDRRPISLSLDTALSTQLWRACA